MKINKIIGTFLILGMSGFLAACSGEKSAEANAEETSASTEVASVATDDAATQNTTTEEVVSIETVANLATIEFEETTHDFGNIKEGAKVEHVFKFKNTGNVPLIVTAVEPSCGCTASDYTKTPVAPGGEGSVSLTFDSSGKPGATNKTAKVKSNIEGGEVVISFRVNVEGAANQMGGAPYK